MGSIAWVVAATLALVIAWLVIRARLVRKKHVREVEAMDVVVHASSIEQVPYECGHQGPKEFELSVYGELSPPLSPTLIDRCPTCAITEIKQEVVRCAACGQGIFPDEAVCTYKLSSNSRLYKNIATIVDRDTALGCMRWECGEAIGMVGTWDGKKIHLLFEKGRTFGQQLFEGDDNIIMISDQPPRRI